MKTTWICAAVWVACISACAAGSDSESPGSGGAAGEGTGAFGGFGASGGAGGATASSSSSSSNASSSSSASSTTGTGGTNLCGNGVINPPEQCDGSEFGDTTCASLGLGSGTLVCNQFCGIVAKACVPKESCYDFLDNDADGLMDCNDDECDGDPSCIDSCSPPKTTGVPSFPNGDTSGRPSVHTASCNGGSSGPEVIYAITAPTDGDLSVSVTNSSFDFDLSLSIRTDCDDDASEIACANLQDGTSFTSEILGIPVTAGTTYFIMIDGVSPTDKGSYYVNIDMPPPEQGFQCTDGWDDDSDGYLDCDDPNLCKGTADCTPGAKTPGEPCFATSECASSDGDPICLNDSQFPGGYCSQFCDMAAPDCTGDSVCAQIGNSVHGVCLDGCVGDGDCRPGYACVDKGLSTLVCALGPEAFCNDYNDNDFDNLTDCEDPDNCQTLPDCASGPNATGQPCTQANQCFANLNDPICISEPYYGWPGGYCSQFCNTAADDCGAGAVCYNWFFFPSGSGTCFDKCSVQADCRPGYFCNDLGNGKKICTF